MDSFSKRLYQSHQICPTCIHPGEVTSFFDAILGALFPGLCTIAFEDEEAFNKYLDQIRFQLKELISHSPGHQHLNIEQVTVQFFTKLSTVYDHLLEDAAAMNESDPAAKSEDEVIRIYPGFYAIAAYRIAHELHLLGLQGIPRVITEYAHSKTGIDIHPGARIGRHFSIDHGTGVVIGETTVIGNHVKLYQGVTLGALSVEKKDAQTKRHPTVEDRVIIYSGATILGGQTTIGHDSIIGGNVWLTRSVPAHSKIYYQSKMTEEETQGLDTVVIKA